MIKINLLGEPPTIDRSTQRWLGAYGASLLVLLVVCFIARALTTARIEVLEVETAALNSELLQLKKQTKEVRELDAKRKELYSKLNVIAQLKLTKVGPVRVLDDLNAAVPERVWLTEIAESAAVLRMSGYALDNQTIAAFMKELERSDFFDTVELVETKQMERAGVKIKLFTLESKINFAGSPGGATLNAAAAGGERAG
jgi:type IV pilus assembly protein PilN